MALKKKVLVLAGILMPFFAVLLMSHNTSAISIGPAVFGLRYNNQPLNNTPNYQWNLDLYAGPNYSVNAYSLNGVRVQTANLAFGGNHASIHAEINIVAWRAGDNVSAYNAWTNMPYINVFAVGATNSSPKIAQTNVTYAITPWDYDSRGVPHRSTLTLYVDLAVADLSQGTNGYIAFLVGNDTFSFASTSGYVTTKYYVEQAPMNIEFSNNINDVLLQTQINQNNTMISLQQQQIDQQNERDKKEDAAISNIENQSQSDINNSTNGQTTSLIGFLSGFISAITNSVGQGNDCSFRLQTNELPDGTSINMMVDPCVGRDKFTEAGGDIFFDVFLPIIAIMFYLPFVIFILRLIYKEIRSFTD